MPFVKGQSGNPGGRKPKEQDSQLIDRLTAFDDEAFKQLEAGLKAGERWAIKMFFEYRYGKPTQRKEVTGAEGGAIRYEDVKDGLIDLYTVEEHLPEYTDAEVMDLAEQIAEYKKAK
jgi:hypothetical protein